MEFRIKFLPVHINPLNPSNHHCLVYCQLTCERSCSMVLNLETLAMTRGI